VVLYRYFAQVCCIYSPPKFEVYPLFIDDSSHSAQKIDLPAIDLTLPWLVSLATIPGLTAIIGAPALLRELQKLSVHSEEVFRGDRLPLLPFPDVVS
jgi:hypothetical protein